MIETPNDNETPARVPWLTVIATFLVLFVFAGLVGLTYYYGSGLNTKPPEESGEDQLKELRSQEQAIVTSYSYDEATKSWHVPVTTAMDALVREGVTKGKWDPFPRTASPPKK